MPPITFLTGDATKPVGSDPRIIAHVCNDQGGWGAGFVLALSKRWTGPEAAYRNWQQGPISLKLGLIQVVEVASDLYVANMVAQSGYLSADNPVPLSYPDLRVCLDKLSLVALEQDASVHMPRIGAGLGGGNWERIEKIINDTLVSAGVSVTVYDLPVKTSAPRNSPAK